MSLKLQSEIVYMFVHDSLGSESNGLTKRKEKKKCLTITCVRKTNKRSLVLKKKLRDIHVYRLQYSSVIGKVKVNNRHIK